MLLARILSKIYNEGGIILVDCNNIKYIRKHYAYFYGYICFRNIINDINTGDDKIIDPNEFIEVSKLSSKQVSKASINQMFVHLFIGEQNDPSELLAYIFEIIHYCKSKKMKFNFTELEENCNENKIINRYRADYKKRYEKEYSLYVRNFIFYTMKTIRCDKCDYVNFNLMPVHILLLPIPSQNSISVFDCLHEYTKKESLDSDYKCDKCKGTDNSTIENSILSDNNTVILQFSRFELNKTCTDYNKNCSQIDFPLNLNLTDYLDDIYLYNERCDTDSIENTPQITFIPYNILNLNNTYVDIINETYSTNKYDYNINLDNKCKTYLYDTFNNYDNIIKLIKILNNECE